MGPTGSRRPYQSTPFVCHYGSNTYDSLLTLVKAGHIALPSIPAAYVQNAHMFYIKLRDIKDRTTFIDSLKASWIMSIFHYIPLHTCPAGEQFGHFAGEDRYTSQESAHLVQLPLCSTRCTMPIKTE